jgi:hypothetical protein
LENLTGGPVMNPNPTREVVIREFVPVGKYRVRLLARPKTREKALDFREYVSTETFEGLCA